MTDGRGNFLVVGLRASSPFCPARCCPRTRYLPFSLAFARTLDDFYSVLNCAASAEALFLAPRAIKGRYLQRARFLVPLLDML